MKQVIVKPYKNDWAVGYAGDTPFKVFVLKSEAEAFASALSMLGKSDVVIYDKSGSIVSKEDGSHANSN